MRFIGRIFSMLPGYFKRGDTYKNGQGEGLLERYVQIYEEDIDQNILPLIENALDNLDPLTAPGKFLTQISYTLGTPPDIFSGSDEYRKVLLYAVSLYKIKGTRKAYEVLFGLLGFTVVLIESGFSDSAYDVPVEFDDPGIEYDGRGPEGNCFACSEYQLILVGATEVTAQIQEAIDNIIIFNEPINAILAGLTITEAAVVEFYIDDNGDLILNNDVNPATTASLQDGNLVLSGSNEDRYSINLQGDIIFA